jgi:hypothetical protein
VACAALPAEAIDGQGLTSEYAGFLAATQVNGTGWGDHQFVQEQGIVVGSELDSLYVSADATDLWIGIPGNLPNKLAASESIVVLIDADASTPQNPNIFTPGEFEPYGGGARVFRYLDGTILEQGFDPETVIVVNRFAETTYVDSWLLIPGSPPAQDPWSDTLVSVDPYNGLYLSAWINTTNEVGVNAGPIPADGAGQQDKAAGAVKGLRLRLDRTYFAIGAEIKIMVLLASPGDNGGTPATYVSNQILPPLQPGYAGSPGCVTPPWPVNFDENYESPASSGLYGFLGPQFAVVALGGGTPGAGGLDGSDIPGNWPDDGLPPHDSLVSTQQIHTCYGDAVQGQLSYTVEGSELDQLFVRADDQYLYIAITGNVEGNGNKVSLWIDADPTQGENTLDANSPAPPNATMIYGWQGRTFDDGFAPEHAYVLNNWQGTLYVDAFHLLLPDANVKQWQGYCPVNGTSDNWVDGGPAPDGNPYGNRFVLNHTNNAGVLSCTDPASPGQPETATSGLEAKISLTELGVPAGKCHNIKVWAVQGGGDSVYLSNQALPSFTPDTCGSVGSYSPAPDNLPFDFGETTPTRGHPAFEGNQFVGVEVRRLGDVDEDVNCCINLDDLNKFVEVLLGLETDPRAVFLSNMNQDHDLISGLDIVDGLDIHPFVVRLIAEGPCP